MVFNTMHNKPNTFVVIYNSTKMAAEVQVNILRELKDMTILHDIHNDISQIMSQMDIKPKQDIIQDIEAKYITNDELLADRKKMFDEAVTTYEEYLEKEGTLKGKCGTN